VARTTGSRKDNPEARMALGEHLRELRRRLILAVSGILVGAVIGWLIYLPLTIGPFGSVGPFHIPGVFDTLQQPIEALRAERADIVTLNFDSIGAAFDMRIRVSMFVGVLITSPWWLYQVFAFITPGLTRKEKQYTYGFLAAAVPLFLAGALLAWSVLPKALEVLMGDLTPEGATNILTATIYLKFVMQFVIAFGIAFLLPLVMIALNFMGVVKAKAWLNAWRWAIIGIFTFCAFATPNPEPTAMLLMALPIVGLYFIAVYICFLHDRRVAKRRAREDSELAESTESIESTGATGAA